MKAALGLDEWLSRIDGIHPGDWVLGLERVGIVADRMGLRKPAPCSVIVAGTNGKGSCCVCLEQILLAAGRRVGCTLSPHLERFNERVRINGAELDDQTLCRSFAAVEAARGEVQLTYFEFTALAALHCFRQAAVEVAVLEVGLGGRLDAFNLVDADLAVVTSIGIDHVDYLGDTRERIGAEKAGVLRAGQQVALGPDMPGSVLEAAARLAGRTIRFGRDLLGAWTGPDRWRAQLDGRRFENLPAVPFPLANCALAIAAADALGGADEQAIRQGLANAWLPRPLRADRRRRPSVGGGCGAQSLGGALAARRTRQTLPERKARCAAGHSGRQGRGRPVSGSGRHCGALDSGGCPAAPRPAGGGTGQAGRRTILDRCRNRRAGNRAGGVACAPRRCYPCLRIVRGGPVRPDDAGARSGGARWRHSTESLRRRWMNEQTRHRITGSLFLLALAIIFLPMLFDGDGVASVQLEPIETDYVPPAVQRFDEQVPDSDFAERVAELRAEVDEQGFHRDTGARLGEPVLSVPNDATEAWAIQLASFADQDNAREFRDRLRADGYEAFVASYKPAAGQAMNRVAVGPLLNSSRARLLLEELADRYDTQGRIMAFGN